jgi:hypothetical protein
LFDHLEVVDFSDFSSGPALESSLFVALLSSAIHLRVLRIGPIQPFDIPPMYRLSSGSLRTLDIDFFSPDFAGRLLAAIAAPGLINLVVRQVYAGVDLLLAVPDLLSRITTFTAHLDIGDHTSLQRLYSALPRLQVLDLTHSSPHTFETYCVWAYSRAQFNLPNPAVNIKTLALCRVPVWSVVDFVRFVRDSAPRGMKGCGIRRVRLEGDISMLNVDGIARLRETVDDFALTDHYSVRKYIVDLTEHTRHYFLPRYFVPQIVVAQQLQ